MTHSEETLKAYAQRKLKLNYTESHIIWQITVADLMIMSTFEENTQKIQVITANIMDFNTDRQKRLDLSKYLWIWFSVFLNRPTLLHSSSLQLWP